MKAKVTISRSSNDIVHIHITDDASGIQFVDVGLTVEAYGYAITGLSEQEGSLEVRGLEYVGKRRVTEQRQIACPLDTYDKDRLVEWLKKNAQEDGWLLSTYLGSQNSVTRTAAGIQLRYSVTKYVSDPA